MERSSSLSNSARLERLEVVTLALGRAIASRAAAMPNMWQLLTMALAIIAMVAGSFYVNLGRLDRIEAQVSRQENRLDRIETKLDALFSKLPVGQ